jgi:hypothetical protein
MISIVPFLLAASVAGSTDVVFHEGFDGDTCPAGRIVHSDISYPISGTGVRRDVDLTVFENIWGHSTNTDEAIMWPGRAGSSPIIEEFAQGGYVAAKFHTPPGMSSTLSGFFKNTSYPSGPNLNFSISEQCADFYPQQSGCLATDIASGDWTLVSWRVSPSNFFCVLEPDTDYFVNMEVASLEPDSQGCSDGECVVHVLNYRGN